MSKKSKILFIFPPAADPISPYVSTPILAGQLKAAGFDVTSLDLSVEYFDYVLNKDFLLDSYRQSKEMLTKLQAEVGDKSIKDASFSSYPFNLKLSILRKENMEATFGSEEENISLIENVANYVNAYRNKDTFYDLTKMQDVREKMTKIFSLLMLRYYPSILDFKYYLNPYYKGIYPSLRKQAIDEEENIFCNFYKEKIKEYKIDEYDLIYISSPNVMQIMPAMTFAKILRETSSAPIVVGGNCISRVAKELQKMPKLFEEFFDYIIWGLGEESVVKLADLLLNKKGSLKSVKGLMYKSGEKVIMNNPDLKYNINKSAIMSLDGFDLSKYYTPDIIMPIQSSKGCYWGKCTFCGYHCPKKKYTVKSTKKTVDEIEFLHKEYGVNYFEFIDEAIHPKYLSKLADEILNRNLNIKYVCCARMETKYYTKEFCEKLFKSGLRIVEFGYESADKDLYNRLNKGVKFENRIECLKQCTESGIFTYVYAIIAYPGETIEQATKTANIDLEYPDYFDFLCLHKFQLDKNSPIFKNHKKFGITEVTNNDSYPFAQAFDFKVKNENFEQEMNEIFTSYIKRTKLCGNKFFHPDEHIFLYVLHYGRDKAKEILCR